MGKIEELYNNYLNNPAIFIREQKSILKKSGFNVNIVEITRDNKVYLSLLDFFNKEDTNIKAEHGFTESLVSILEKYTFKIRNSCTISLKNGSHIKFCPYKENGIEISRVYVKPCNQNCGNGSYLMSLFFSSILSCTNEFSEIFLECTGNINDGNNNIENDISAQIKFFRKFGFRVDRNSSKHPYYVKMVFDFRNLVNNEFKIENLNK
jgi:hypothetical protein